MIAMQGPSLENEGVYAEETFRFLALPELWQVALVIVPAVLLFAWWTYGGLQRMALRSRVILATLRGLAIGVILFALFQPAVEQVRYTTVRTQVQVLVTTAPAYAAATPTPTTNNSARASRASSRSVPSARSVDRTWWLECSDEPMG